MAILGIQKLWGMKPSIKSHDRDEPTSYTNNP